MKTLHFCNNFKFVYVTAFAQQSPDQIVRCGQSLVNQEI
jgi:hypothetical protein